MYYNNWSDGDGDVIRGHRNMISPQGTDHGSKFLT